MGDKFKILFSTMGFSCTGNALKLFPKWCARYFGRIRRFFVFSAVFKRFTHYLLSYGTYSHIFGTCGNVLRYWQYADVVFKIALAVF